MDILSTEAVVGTAVVGAGIVYALAAATRKSPRELDAATLALLTDELPTPPKECQAIVLALNNAAVTDDEAECTEQMRSIVQAGHLPYKSLAADPELLLKCSEHMMGAAPGALWTRFTVSYNLYAGSVVALGSDEQRTALYAMQPGGELGCFAFTELGAGVLSGAGVETTATYDTATDSFVIHSPTPSSRKTWISQGCYAEHAVILAELLIAGKSYGPHLFHSRIATPSKSGGRPTAVKGVEVTSLPKKIALRGLDNAYIMFDHFSVPRSAMLSRFATVDAGGAYTLKLPTGVKRMLDLLISRLLTGRIVLSEATVGYTRALVRRSWKYCANRTLWKGRKPEGPLMSTMPLVQKCFRDYSRSLAIVAAFIAETRVKVAEAILQDSFPEELIEATCMCKFVGTGFAVDAVSAMRKLMGSRAMQADAWLGEGSFVCNATCAAEGDNTIMELKVVQDMVRGRTPRFPASRMARCCTNGHGRRAVRIYLSLFAQAMLLGKAALHEGQLLKDLAWARLHLRVIDTWLSTAGSETKWLDSYAKTMMIFPVPITM